VQLDESMTEPDIKTSWLRLDFDVDGEISLEEFVHRAPGTVRCSAYGVGRFAATVLSIHRGMLASQMRPTAPPTGYFKNIISVINISITLT
jgi:hypothetical protein